ncbi:MAG TPA: hypothetical protein PKK06_11250 [Phycisphaerae bacterium]|nr:hypothetical protein [Phycisphaerae bacterium]HNU45816.1 hypothetical protein [Phycisphaerae bacterium]
MTNRWTIGGAIAGLVVLAAVWVPGCHLRASPFMDIGTEGSQITTPSAEAARASGPGQPSALTRAHEPIVVATEGVAVTHAPLYFETSSEVREVSDDRVVWIARDYMLMLGGPARFLVNLAALPVSLVDTPFWWEMASDGQMGRRTFGLPYDAVHVR